VINRILACLALLIVLIVAQGCHGDSANTAKASSPETIEPLALAVERDVVYAVDSVRNKITDLTAGVEIETLPFDVPFGAEYHRSDGDEWIVSIANSKGIIWYRPNQGKWRQINVRPIIRRSMTFANSLFVQHSDAQDRHYEASVERIEKGEVAGSWRILKTWAESSYAAFQDVNHNLIRVREDGSSWVELRADESQTMNLKDSGSFVCAATKVDTFISVKSELWRVNNRRPTRLPVTGVQRMMSASDGEFAWFLGQHSGSPVVLVFYNGKWQKRELPIGLEATPTIKVSGNKAIVLLRTGEQTEYILLTLGADEIQISQMSRTGPVFYRNVVFAGGTWWLPLLRQGEVVRVEHSTLVNSGDNAG
jgi:hypothetical protein